MTRDIVERLKETAIMLPRSGYVSVGHEATEAADEITALRARLEAMKKEQEADHANINLKADFIEKTLDQLAGAEDRAERAEAALATARRDALLDAAKVCDKIVSGMIYFNEGARKKDKMFADRIRALANEAET